MNTSDGLIHELESVGFRTLNNINKTNEWKSMVNKRVKEWRTNSEELTNDLGKDGYNELLTFYTMIQNMFNNEHVGGTIIVVTKPKGW